MAEYRACQDVQRRTWGIEDDSYVVPVATLISVQHAGGLVLGAFQGERLIGFAFGYLGRVHGEWALYSQLVGVDPGVQAAGVGGQLKQAQRAWARSQGLSLVAWSYDPLQAGNANFNLHRLGAFCRTYHVNYFGERTDALSAGLESDRLLAEWPAEDTTPTWPDAPLLTLIDIAPHDGAATPILAKNALAGLNSARTLHLPIPPDIAALKASNPSLAHAWQLAVRAAFQHAFAAGYVAMDFLRPQGEDDVYPCYVLKRRA